VCQALEELTHRVSLLEWTVGNSDGSHAHQQMDMVKRRLEQPVKAMD